LLFRSIKKLFLLVKLRRTVVRRFC
jgi:hypothetical protein